MNATATRHEVQPYFRAFMIERGYRCASQAANVDFMCWIQRQWRDFERATGRQVDPVCLRGTYRAEFAEWLEGRSFDALAREPVEARAA